MIRWPNHCSQLGDRHRGMYLADNDQKQDLSDTREIIWSLPNQINFRPLFFVRRRGNWLIVYAAISLVCKAKRQYLFACEVSRYCLLASHCRILWDDVVDEQTAEMSFTDDDSALWKQWMQSRNNGLILLPNQICHGHSVEVFVNICVLLNSGRDIRFTVLFCKAIFLFKKKLGDLN